MKPLKKSHQALRTIAVKTALTVVLCLGAFIKGRGQTLSVSNGAVLSVGASLELRDMDIVNDGSITSSEEGNLILTGGDCAIRGSGSTSLNNLEIRKDGQSGVSLMQNLDVAGSVGMAQGNLDLNNSRVELKYPGGRIVNEKEESRIMSRGNGEVFITMPVQSPKELNPGGLGIRVSSREDWGTTTIRRGHRIQTNEAGDESIARCYTISPENADVRDAAVDCGYFTSELNALDRQNLQLMKLGRTGNWEAVKSEAAPDHNNALSGNTVFSLYVRRGKVAASANESAFSAAPNPTTGKVSMTFVAQADEPLVVAIIDVSGRMLTRQEWAVKKGSNSYAFDMTAEPSGIYMLVLAGAMGERHELKIVKQ
jgi:hypothetical protein